MDSPENGYDIILAWKEVKDLGLRQRPVAPIYRPPSPKPDPGDKEYQDYQQRIAKNKAAREERRTNDKGNPSAAGSTNKTGKQHPSQS
ncbi:hypothetical protein DIS24_g11073 [Lasiodiplodia hormozganensis]|uniref:Uncharacterized protein n=1 Tax=Lasiodiplodia hormozganensis TaxID=869390 RepID=A0AA39X1K4_9PEZI|nr:hypothetical protein DIS24_g11073 [Lasiodiplodia hormozganensis]